MELIVLAGFLGVLYYLIGRYGTTVSDAERGVPATIARGWRMLAACGRLPQIPGH
ncbi:hypothetical protein GCM10027591_10340 [Zhihengliuella somnathii]